MADVLLNQRVIAGLGNVFKSEVLFECRVYPFDHVRDLEPDTIAALVAASARALRKNVTESASRPGGRRTTTNRLNRDETVGISTRRQTVPSMRCRDSDAQGRSRRRSTYWCPSCQPSRRSDGSDGGHGL